MPIVLPFKELRNKKEKAIMNVVKTAMSLPRGFVLLIPDYLIENG